MRAAATRAESSWLASVIWNTFGLSCSSFTQPEYSGCSGLELADRKSVGDESWALRRFHGRAASIGEFESLTPRSRHIGGASEESFEVPDGARRTRRGRVRCRQHRERRP